MIEEVRDLDRVRINRIGIGDVFDALSKGFDDFNHKPSHYFFVAVMWPIFGVVIWYLVIAEKQWWWLFPLAAGFSLIGPGAALLFYEMSRRREKGLETTWAATISSIPGRTLLNIALLTVVLLVIFAGWLLSAQMIYNATMGPGIDSTFFEFLNLVFTTPEGRQLLLIGNLTGLGFAFLVLLISAVSFPMVLDRAVGPVTAMGASASAVMRNLIPMLVWGLIIAGLLALGTLVLFFGLAVALPVLGHGTWHLYRKVVVPPPGTRHEA